MRYFALTNQHRKVGRGLIGSTTRFFSASADSDETMGKNPFEKMPSAMKDEVIKCLKTLEIPATETSKAIDIRVIKE